MRTIAIAALALLAGCTTPQGQAVQAVKERAVTEAETVADTLARDAYSIICSRLSYRAEMTLRNEADISADSFNAFCNRDASADERR